MMTCAGGGALLLLFGLAVELLDLRRKAMVPVIGLFVGGVCYAAWSFQRSVRVRVADLEAARRGAVEAALSKAQFLANMSHEIRTPMNGILGMAELLARTTLDTEQLQMATTIRSSAESLLAVLNDVLDYSKIEAGKVDLEAADFDLWQVVDDCAGLLHSQAEQKGVELMTFVDPRLWRTHSGDQGRVRQVLLNLLTNAVKFTLEGEVVLSADLVDESESEQVVRISVRDTGIGISEEALARLFSPFSQADASTTRRFGGTGLGLSICRRLVELMGGRVDVESVPDKGSTFWFELRLRRGAIENTRPRAADVDLSKCSLLIVDYNETNRQLMVMQLAPTRIGIDVADNAISAIEVLRKATGSGCPFTMAVIDVAMPGIDGMQLAHAIRNDSEIRAMPMVLVSSLGARPGSEAMNRAGVFRWLSKPLAAGRLLQVVRDMALVRQPAGNGQRRGDAMQVLGSGSQLAGLRLLVAEDNEINRRVIAGMLRRIGCEVTFAVDGREAVQLVEQREFDLVFMDCQMPEMDGFEATRRIRQMGGARAEVPIVALTANVLASDRDACQRAGMSDFLAKPVKLDVLRAAVQRWGRPPAAAAPASPPAEGGDQRS